MACSGILNVISDRKKADVDNGLAMTNEDYLNAFLPLETRP